MQEKRKKFWITFSIVTGSIFLLCLVFGIVTNLKTVNVEFRQRLGSEDTKLEQNILEKVRDDGEFEYGKGLLFVDVNTSISKIEKENPFVKVEQIIRRFPNEISVYISERVPVMYVQTNEYYFVLDKDFKVLDKFENNSQGNEYLKTNYKYVYEIDYSFQTANYNAGDFIQNDDTISTYKDIYKGIYGALCSDEVEWFTNVEKVVLDGENIKIIMDNNVTILLEGLDDLVIKTYTAVEFFEKIEQTTSAKVIRIRKIDGQDNKYSAYLYA